MVFLKKNYIDPTGRQNFGDAPGQIPKLILTLCHMMYMISLGVHVILMLMITMII